VNVGKIDEISRRAAEQILTQQRQQSPRFKERNLPFLEATSLPSALSASPRETLSLNTSHRAAETAEFLDASRIGRYRYMKHSFLIRSNDHEATLSPPRSPRLRVI
jgi:hypothetical protein